MNNDLPRLLTLLDEGVKAVAEINENMKYINENKDVVDQLDTVDQLLDPVTSIPLEHSKHREFVEGVKHIIDVCQNLNHYEAAQDSCSLPRLKALLQQEEMSFRNNRHLLQEIVKCTAELKSLQETVSDWKQSHSL